jgi:hypothetical protein
MSPEEVHQDSTRHMDERLIVEHRQAGESIEKLGDELLAVGVTVQMPIKVGSAQASAANSPSTKAREVETPPESFSADLTELDLQAVTKGVENVSLVSVQGVIVAGNVRTSRATQTKGVAASPPTQQESAPTSSTSVPSSVEEKLQQIMQFMM